MFSPVPGMIRGNPVKGRAGHVRERWSVAEQLVGERTLTAASERLCGSAIDGLSVRSDCDSQPDARLP